MSLDKKVWGMQEGGDHYKNMAIQPTEFVMRNNLTFLEGCVVKRICRKKGGQIGRLDDLLKIKHEIDMILDLEGFKFPPEEQQAGLDWFQRLEAIIEETKFRHDIKHGTPSPPPEKPAEIIDEFKDFESEYGTKAVHADLSENRNCLGCIHRDTVGVCRDAAAIKFWLCSTSTPDRFLCAERWKSCPEYNTGPKEKEA